MKMEPDPVIERIRAVRRQISESVGNDPQKLVQHYMDLQAKHKDRLITDWAPVVGPCVQGENSEEGVAH